MDHETTKVIGIMIDPNLPWWLQITAYVAIFINGSLVGMCVILYTLSGLIVLIGRAFGVKWMVAIASGLRSWASKHLSSGGKDNEVS